MTNRSPSSVSNGESIPSADGTRTDPAPFIVLAELWRGYQETPERVWSLAKLAKQSQLAMSTLRRHLNTLANAGLVEFESNERGIGWAALSEEGRALCLEAFGATGSEVPGT